MLALSIGVDGEIPDKTHDGKAHSSSWYTMLYSGVIGLYE